MCETTSRDHFSGNSLKYYQDFLRIIPGSELIFVKSENTVVSAGIFVFSQEISLYYYGASTSDKQFRNMMGPYLMQYFAIQKAKDFGSKWYDFLGVATPGEEDSPLA
jgi:lipid II:glycine glycyltransferase (peptidoglycan interpeptide bridge formation enzyme)